MTKFDDVGDKIRKGTFDPSKTRPAASDELVEEVVREQKRKVLEARHYLKEQEVVLERLEGSNPRELLNESAPLVSSFADKAFDRFEARRTGKEKPVPLPWDTLNEALNGGLWPGYTWWWGIREQARVNGPCKRPYTRQSKRSLFST